MITRIELEEVKKQIRNEPNRMYMRCWTDEVDCNTTHCIGGWLQALYTDKYSIDVLFNDKYPYSENNMPDRIGKRDNKDYDSNLFQVSKWLNFISEELRKDIRDSFIYHNDFILFNYEENEDDCWIFDFDNENYDNIDNKERVELACRVIDEYIENYDVK